MEICAHFGVCGGCSKQNLPYEEQLSLKERAVAKALEDFPVASFERILGSPEIFFYRNKMEYSFGDERDVAILNRGRNYPAEQTGLRSIASSKSLRPISPAGQIEPIPTAV